MGYGPSAHVLPLTLMLAGNAAGADQAFRLIVLRWPREQDLFEAHAPYRYHAIASNRRNEDAAATMAWYCQRGDASENRIKDLKIGFGMEHMPRGTFSANAVFFAIMVLSYKSQAEEGEGFLLGGGVADGGEGVVGRAGGGCGVAGEGCEIGDQGVERMPRPVCACFLRDVPISLRQRIRPRSMLPAKMEIRALWFS